MRLGIVDIGSNSIRLAVYEIIGKSYRAVNQIKHSVRLAKNMENGYLLEDRIDAALETLAYFRKYIRFNNIEVTIAVATEAVRKARNQGDFISRAQSTLGCDIRVLTGMEEAYYDYLATVNTIDIKDALVFDLGGASTEIIYIKNRIMEESISIPIGGINLTEKFNMANNPTENNFKDLYSYIQEHLNSITWLNKIHGLNIIGIGGSSRTIGKIDRYLKNSNSFISHNYSLTRNDLNKINKLTKDYLINDGKKVRGLMKDREDIFLSSLSLVMALSEKVDSKRIFVSGSGLRDGILFEYLYGYNRLIPDVLEFSLNNIISQHMSEIYNGQSLWKIVSKIFDYIYHRDRKMMSIRKSLKVATYLYDLGNNINFFQKDRNTFYSILNAPINGLNQKQILMAASIATLYNSDDILKDYLNRKILNDSNISEIEKAGIILKIGRAITYGLNNDVKLENIFIQKGKLNISISSSSPLIFLNDELSYVTPSFKKVTGLDLSINTNIRK